MNINFLLASLALGQSIEMPATQRGAVGEIIMIQPKLVAGGKVVFFRLDAGLSVFPAEKLVDPTELVFVASAPGKYRILATLPKATSHPSHPFAPWKSPLTNRFSRQMIGQKTRYMAHWQPSWAACKKLTEKLICLKFPTCILMRQNITPKAKTLGEWNIALRRLSTGAEGWANRC
jgi:hypothetical protein